MLTQLPPELILSILQHLQPADEATIPTLLAVSLTSSVVLPLARSSSLWRPILAQEYPLRPSPPAAVLEETGADDAAFFAFRHRAERDRRARELVRELQKPENRLPTMEELRSIGPDVIEHLERPAAFTEEKRPESWLSLQYWARATRLALLRQESVDVWTGITQRAEAGEENEDDFEKGLDAFGAFRGLDPLQLPRDRYDPSLHTRLVEATSHPPYEGPKRLEWIANEVVEYMSSIGLKAAADGAFHNLDNHFVGLVWQDAGSSNSGSLPMTLVAVFCSLLRRLPVAQRFGICAKPIGFPGTMLAGVFHEGSEEVVYLNVYGGGKVIKREAMEAIVRAMGQPVLPEFFRPASAREMCLRVARNILTSVRQGERAPGQAISHQDAIESLYGVAHALFILVSPGDVDPPELVTYGEWLVSLVQAEYPLDVTFIEQRVLPRQEEERRERTKALCEAIRQDDKAPKEKKWVSAAIKWRIGHVFRHRLFGYLAVVRGWDYTCEASETWIQQMRVDTLPYGRHQPFYHVIVEDGSVRYVANENITDTPIHDFEVDAFLSNETLGRYFRKRERREDGRWTFVPSLEVEAEYPDS
ncbi:hypothetical protein JCM10213_003339 [Rhodosporidiobolus nylandii]